MFIDYPTIPAQLEVLLDVLYVMRDKKTDNEALKKIIQPKGLPGLTDSSAQIKNHIKAAMELDLIELDDSKNYRLKNKKSSRDYIAKVEVLKAFDQKVLSNTTLDAWTARVYSYLILKEDDIGPIGSNEQELFAKEFMASLSTSIEKTDPMNNVKYPGVIKWYCYSGMGWLDPSGAFVPDPTLRLKRVMHSVWQNDRNLDVETFISRVARTCPELDGGVIFQEVSQGSYNASEKTFTRALATALWRLHDENEIRLVCPNDTGGWHLTRAGTGKVRGQASNRVLNVEKLERVGV